MKKLALLSILFCSPVMAESFEVCTYEGPCALKVTDDETKSDIWLVTESGVDLATIWGGEWYLTTSDDYEKIRNALPESQRWTTKAIEPTSGTTLMEAKAAAPKAPAPSGPLVSGSISITTTIGGGNCSDCHKGSHYDIHKKKLDTGGK